MAPIRQPVPITEVCMTPKFVAVAALSIAAMIPLSAQSSFGVLGQVPGLTLSAQPSSSAVTLRHVSAEQAVFEAKVEDVKSFSQDDKHIKVEFGRGSYTWKAGDKSAADTFERLALTFAKSGDIIAFRIEK